MAITATVQLDVTVREPLTGVPAAPNAPLTHNGFNTTASLSATSVPPIDTPGVFEKTLVAGVATIDLTAIPKSNGGTWDATGKKLQAMKIKSKAANSNLLIVGKGATNGYGLHGKAWSMPIQPGEEIDALYKDKATMPAVAAGAKTIDLSDDSAGGTDTFEIVLLLG